MSKIYFEKNVGETTLECIKRLKAHYPELKDEKIGHAGTLDPLASGVMLFLVGEDTKEFLEIQKMHKTYSFTIIFGVETDSYDILGIPKLGIGLDMNIDNLLLKKVADSFLGKIMQTPPAYSAIRIKGKPLYWWKRNGRLDELNLQPREREIFKISVSKIYEFGFDGITNMLPIIKKLDGDFRQREIVQSWNDLLQSVARDKISHLPAADFVVECSSGTYIRSLISDIGRKLGASCFTHNIIRLEIK